MTSSADGQDRLQEIWAAWSLTPDETMSKAQLGALDAVAKWLEAGQTDPEIMIRAVQLLLADPERPDVRQRSSWTNLRKAVQKKWTNAGTGRDHFSYGQALLLAAWPNEENGWLTSVPLLDSAWVLRRGNEPKEFSTWRRRVSDSSVENLPNNNRAGIAEVTTPKALPISPFTGITLPNHQAEFAHIERHQQYDFSYSGSRVLSVLRAHDASLTQVSSALVSLSHEAAHLGSSIQKSLVGVNGRLSSIATELRSSVREALEASSTKLNLLWWGQSRYCRALRKPYLRMKSDPAALLWWTAREAAELSLSVEVEPAAAYLVETLHSLDQGIDDKKPVLAWMQELHATLKRSPNVQKLSAKLDKIASEDCLGMPVTWVRRQVANKDEFDDKTAKDAVALNLEEEIDRGDWASWVFRETLLDLHLAGTQ